MVLDFYKLSEQPFGVTPDPRYLYLSHVHREALASLHYGVVERRGFTALIASPGLGKTTLLFDFLSKISDSARTVFLFQSQCNPRSFLRNLLEDLRIPCEGGDIGQMQRQLNGCLISESKAGRRLIVIIDEAQNLDESVLEFVRTLSNFETSSEKLLHCILTGQPRLAEILAKPRLEQLRQRISILARLHPLNLQDTQRYIEHRLRVAGYDSRNTLFTKRALTTIFQQSHGIPRNINKLCFNAMCLGCVAKIRTIDADVIGEVLRDLDLQSFVPEPSEAPQPEMPKHTKQRRQPQIDRATIAKDASSRLFRGWQLKIALAMGLVAIVLAIIFVPSNKRSRVDLVRSFTVPYSPTVETIRRIFHLADRLHDGQSDGIRTVSSSSEPPLVSPEPRRSTPPSFVIVRPNQNIFRICLEQLGRYDEQTLAKIRKLNPELNADVDQIRVGQRIRLPMLRNGHESEAESRDEKQGDPSSSPKKAD